MKDIFPLFFFKEVDFSLQHFLLQQGFLGYVKSNLKFVFMHFCSLRESKLTNPILGKNVKFFKKQIYECPKIQDKFRKNLNKKLIINDQFQPV